MLLFLALDANPELKGSYIVENIFKLNFIKFSNLTRDLFTVKIITQIIYWNKEQKYVVLMKCNVLRVTYNAGCTFC